MESAWLWCTVKPHIKNCAYFSRNFYKCLEDECKLSWNCQFVMKTAHYERYWSSSNFIALFGFSMTMLLRTTSVGLATMSVSLWYNLPILHSGVWFTKYPTTILRLSHDNAIDTIDLQRMSNLQNILQRTQSFSFVWFTRKIVRSSEIVFVN